MNKARATYAACLTAGIWLAVLPAAGADVYINVMAVNGSPDHKETAVKFNLPGDLKAEDILDTNGLKLDYNVNDANYVVSGTVSLDSKQSKTFRVRVKDIWKMSTGDADAIKQEIDRGFEQIGKLRDPEKAALLKQQLSERLDYINQAQGAKADTVAKRIDAYRAYRKELEHIKDQALAVDFWHSEPGKDEEKIIRIKLDASNPATATSNKVKIKEYLPAEIKPQNVVEDQGFEVRYDQDKQQAFLYKEDEITVGQKKSFTIGIRDVWTIPQRNIDYLRTRANYANDFLKTSKFKESAKYLNDHLTTLLADIEHSQSLTLPIKDHIGAFRVNQRMLEDARTDVENMEKLLMVLREDLEKSKVENVLQKVRSLKGVAGIAEKVFDKKPEQSTAWGFIGWILLGVGALTVINLGIWFIRSQDKKKNAEQLPPQQAAEAKK